jgi:hypothetical protein
VLENGNIHAGQQNRYPESRRAIFHVPSSKRGASMGGNAKLGQILRNLCKFNEL